jgi:hypothetical protein
LSHLNIKSHIKIKTIIYFSKHFIEVSHYHPSGDDSTRLQKEKKMAGVRNFPFLSTSARDLAKPIT